METAIEIPGKVAEAFKEICPYLDSRLCLELCDSLASLNPELLGEAIKRLTAIGPRVGKQTKLAELLN